MMAADQGPCEFRRSLPRFVLICGLLVFASRLPATCHADEVKPYETVIFFPTCGHFDAQQQAWIVPIHGWLFKLEQNTLAGRFTLGALRRALDLEPTPGEEPTFLRRGGPFVVDNVDGRELSVRLGGDFIVLEPSGENGHAVGTIRIPLALAPTVSRNGWLSYQADTAEGDLRRLIGTAMLLPPRGVSVISDVDDTIKITQVAQRREMLANTFLRPMESVPGMVELYRRWAADGAVFHYVTASPWQLYAPLEDFRHSAGFPAGTFDMALFRWKDRTVFNLLTDPDKLKQAAIEDLLTRFPERRFICVGDSGQHDPELYTALARKHPGQIIGIYIRNITRETPDNDRCRRVFAGLPPGLWRLYNDPAELNEVLIPAVQPAGAD